MGAYGKSKEEKTENTGNHRNIRNHNLKDVINNRGKKAPGGIGDQYSRTGQLHLALLLILAVHWHLNRGYAQSASVNPRAI